MNFNTTQYKRSRGAYMAQCTVEYFITLLVTDAFLTKLLTHIGISDYLVGIISSFISMAFVIQLAAIFLVRINVSTKKGGDYDFSTKNETVDYLDKITFAIDGWTTTNNSESSRPGTATYWFDNFEIKECIYPEIQEDGIIDTTQ